MDFIIVGGYGYSGSSIANDLIKECNGYKGFDIEFKLLTAVDAILDLETALFINPIFYKTGIALERFINFYKKLGNKRFKTYNYEDNFCDDFMDLMDDFVDRIVTARYKVGSSLFTLEEGTKYFSFGAKGYRLELKRLCFDQKDSYFCDLNREDFLAEAQKLLHRIFDRYEKEGIHTCILDQGLYPAYASRLKDYFPAGKMIIVDRDPRDNAVSMIESGKAIGASLRENLNANFYCRWFTNTRRKYGNVDAKDVLYTRYEDYALKYEESRKNVFNFAHIDFKSHVEQYKYFDPKRTAAKVGRWKWYEKSECFSRQEWLSFCREVKETIPEYCFERDE